MTSAIQAAVALLHSPVVWVFIAWLIFVAICETREARQ